MTTIKIRRDTAANWTANNPILATGEPGLETDTKKIKYGDGSTAWNSLSYAGSTTTFTFPSGNGTNNQLLQSNGDGTTTWSTRTSPIPSQSGNSGKYLTTDGSAVSWGTVAAGGGTPTAILWPVNNSNNYYGNIGWNNGTNVPTDNNWKLINDGGTGITVNGHSFTIPAGTWFFEVDLGFSFDSSHIAYNFKLIASDSTLIISAGDNGLGSLITFGNGYIYHGSWTAQFTLTGTKTITLNADTNGSWAACARGGGMLKFTKVA